MSSKSHNDVGAKDMRVVFGASGRAGSEVAGAIIESGRRVRVVVRRREQGDAWKGRGADVAVASLDDVDAVSAALAGADGAFLINPPPVRGDPYARAAEVGAVLAEAVRRANLPKAVVLSSVGAQHAADTGVIATLNQIEDALADAAPSIAFLRSGYFVETWEEVAGSAIVGGVLPTFLDPGQRIPMVSTMDIGSAAARLLDETWAGTRIVELSGPEDWSACDVATAFATVLRRPVEPMLVPVDQRAAALAETGLSADVVTALLGMYEGIANGRVERQEGTEHRRGTTPLTAAIERIVTKLRGSA